MKINKLVLLSLLFGTTMTLVADIYPSNFATQMTDKYDSNVEHYEAADGCSMMEPQGTWRLPTLNELIALCGPGQSVQYNCDEDYLWTSKRVESEEVVSQNWEGAWLGIRPTTHEWLHGSYWDGFRYRCVK